MKRFHDKVDRSGGPGACWPWMRCTTDDGYGIFTIGGRNVYAHRMAYELATGEVLGALEADHLCHNPPCCNPRHLRSATRKQNGENRKGASRNSRSGVRGVTWHTQKLKWQGRVTHHGKVISVGLFHTIEEADAAVTAKRLELFTPIPATL